MTEAVITSSVIIVILLIIRVLFKSRMKSSFRYSLWLIVMLRLMLPFSLTQSGISIMNLIDRYRTAPVQSAYEQQTYPKTENYTAHHTQYTEIPDNDVPYTAQNKKALSAADIFGIIRVTGTAAMLIWFAAVNISFYIRLKRSRREAGRSGPLKIYTTDIISSPCVFGIIPRIYLTPEIAEDEDKSRFAVTHELCHYYHGDMIWAVVRCILLAVYWFDPLVWAAAYFSKLDCECACDEAVIKRVGSENRIAYGRSLIDILHGKRSIGIAAAGMASGKSALKERIKLIADRPVSRPAAVICSVLIVGAACGCTFTSAKSISDEAEPAYTETAGTADEENNTELLSGFTEFTVYQENGTADETVFVYTNGNEENGSYKEKDTEYVSAEEFYRNIVESPEWKTKDRIDRGEMLQLPEEMLENMSTGELAEAVLEYPFYMDIYAFNDIQTGFDAMYGSFNGVRKLSEREDAGTVLLNMYMNEPVLVDADENSDVFRITDMEILISQDFVLDKLQKPEMEVLVSTAAEKYKEKQESEVYGEFMADILYDKIKDK